MDDRTKQALRGSIEKWRDIANGTGVDLGRHNCPLCREFLDTDLDRGLCIGCPVSWDTGKPSCLSTPFEEWCDHQIHNHPEENTRKKHCPECAVLAQHEENYLQRLLHDVVSGEMT